MPYPRPDRIGVACSGLLIERGKILLVRETKPHVFGQYNLPAGKLESNESIQDGVRREFFEESGLRVKLVKLIGVYERVRAIEGNHMLNFVFLVKRIGGRIRPTPEHPEVRFFSIAEIRKLKRRKLLRTDSLLTALGDHKKGQSVPPSFVKQYSSTR